MTDKILFSTNENMSNAIALPPPFFGYTVQLTKAVTIRRNAGNVSCYNHGSRNDFRDVEFTLLMDKDEVILLRGFFESLKNISTAKTEFYIQTSKNFFAAGPEQGDNGIFKVALANNPQFSSMMTDPFGFFECKMKLIFIDLQQIVPHKQQPESNWSWNFGSVMGLRNPERSPVQEYAAVRDNSLSGRPFVKSSFFDEFTTTITQKTTTEKMSELVYFLQMQRGGNFVVDAGENYWLFGADSPESGKMDVRLLDNQFIFVHEGPDLWSVNIALWRYVPYHKPVADPPIEPPKTDNTFTDPRDGKVYKIIRVGGLEWMAENLDYEMQGSQIYPYPTDSDFDYPLVISGRIYDFQSALTASPPGWRLPTEAEWRTLASSVGGEHVAGEKLKAKPPSWNGTDSIGFNALLANHLNFQEDDAHQERTAWWSSTISQTDWATRVSVEFDPTPEMIFFDAGDRNILYIRCVRPIGDA